MSYIYSMCITRKCMYIFVKATHRDSTSAAQHKTQGKRKADRWKKDYERRREERETLLIFPSPKSLNYYW